MTTAEKRGYTYADAATYLGSSERVVKQLVHDGVLPAKYIGARVVIDIADLDAYFDGLPTERT